MSAAEKVHRDDETALDLRAELTWRRALADAARRRYHAGQTGHAEMVQAEAALGAVLDLWGQLEGAER